MATKQDGSLRVARPLRTASETVAIVTGQQNTETLASEAVKVFAELKPNATMDDVTRVHAAVLTAQTRLGVK